MRRIHRLMIPAVVVLLTLVLSAFCITPALADDSTPPSNVPAVSQPAIGGGSTNTAPATTDAASAPAADGSASTTDPATAAPANVSAPATAAPASTDVSGAASAAPSSTDAVSTSAADVSAPASATPPPTDKASAPAGVPAPATHLAAPKEASALGSGSGSGSASLLSQVPEGTQLVVTDASGNAIPLASQEAAQAVATTGDPVWCPTGINPGGAGCTGSQSSFSALLGLISSKTVAGTIWIETSYNSSTGDSLGVNIIGSSLGTTQNYALTLKGGWNGSLGSLAAITGTSTFNVPLTINWNSDVSLSDIIITGLTDPASTALSITTPRNVTLTRVNVHNNNGVGAMIDDHSGTGAVTVSSSQFSNNAGTTAYTAGLVVNSTGAITLSSVTADGNGNAGVRLTNNYLGSAAAVTVSGTNDFSSNSYTGLIVYSNGVISLNNVTADSSTSGAGVYLDNCNSYEYDTTNNYYKCLVSTAHTVTLTGSNYFNNNDLNGLSVYSNGAITVNNLTANYDTNGDGVYLDNCAYADPNNYYAGCTNAAASVTLTGNNYFNNNGYVGLDVETTGTITANALTANYNGGTGAYLDNCQSYEYDVADQYYKCSALSAHTVTLTGSNTFNYNSYAGLVVESLGAITTNNLTATWNSGGDGVNLDNSWSMTPQVVTVAGTNQFNDNGYNGLEVYSSGVITLNNITANYNGQYGDPTDGWGANINNTYAVSAQSVMLTGTNQFNNNEGMGLEVESYGVITANSITANNNGVLGGDPSDGWGATLDNSYASGAQPITLTGTNQFNGNEGTGLGVWSNGAITASNLTANGNLSWMGAYLENDTAFPAQPVTVNGSVTNNNNWTGLVVNSYGLVTLSNITSNSNGSYDAGTDSYSGEGVYVNNTANYNSSKPAGVAGVTLTGTNNINSNWTNGLEVYTNGAVLINNLTADYDGYFDTPTDTVGDAVYGYGATINNSTALTAQAITMTGVNAFDYNWSGGLNALSKGAITLTDVDAIGNNGTGAYLDNTANKTIAAGVTLINTNVFSENSGRGLWVETNGTITVSNLVANANGGRGAWLDNCGYDQGSGLCTTSTIAPVTVSGTNQFKANGGGLAVFSNGLITLNNITASSNKTGSGVWVDNTHSPTSLGVTITGTNLFDANASAGLFLITRGPATVSNLTATNNGFSDSTSGYGVDIENWTATTAQPVTLTGTNFFSYNNLTGLWLLSNGAISISNLTANSNGNLGAYIQNCAYSSSTSTECTSAGVAVPQNVTFTGYVNLFNNSFTGMNVWSYGTISLNNVTAKWNGHGGVYLDNCVYDDLNPSACDATLPRAITLTGNNSFDGNSAYGLWVKSLGAITVNNVNADNNGTYGTDLENDFPGAVGAVSVNNTPAYSPDFSSNGGYGLYILSRGTITVMDLGAQGNGADGVLLNNTSNTAGTAAVNLGTARANWSNWISWNTDSGLEVYSNGLVTLSNLDAENNGNYNGTTYQSSGYGVWIDNSTSSLSQGVTLNGTWNGFKNNYLSGLEVYTKGVVTLNNIDTDNNGYNNPATTLDDGNVYGYGVRITNNANNAAPKNVTLNGSNNFYGNADDGLLVQSFGLVTLNKVNADTNGMDGIYVDNATGALASQLKGVTILGYADVYNNPGYGLYINSLGAISVNTIDADNNNGIGAYIDNHLGNPGIGVTFTGNIVTSNNLNEGMDVLSRGAIAFNSLTDAWIGNNGSYGWNLNNSYTGSVGGITMTIAVNQNIDFNNNGGYGLLAQSLGAITTNNLDANGNWGGYGVTLDNAFPSAAATATITMNDPSTWDNNFNNNSGDGLDVLSNRLITLNTITAQNNSGFGAYIDNCGYDWISMTCTSSITPVSGVTLNGTNDFDSNYNSQDGLWITSKGAITVSNLTARWNGWDGAYLDNQWPSAVGGITLTGTNDFEGNSNIGLEAFSKGAISMNNVSSNWNTEGGASLDNHGLSAPQSVTLTGYNYFNGNNDGNSLTHNEFGLQILSDGAITLNNIMASFNDGFGALLNNTTSASTPRAAITLNGINTFNNNTLDGLDLYSLGAVTLNNLTADNNGGEGLNVQTQGAITVACGSMTNNGSYGWKFNTPGTITLKAVWAFGNNGGGSNNTDKISGTLVNVRTCP